jgi:peptide chain release factor 2
MRERTVLSGQVDSVKALTSELDDIVGMMILAEEEGENSLITESEQSLDNLKAKAAKMELESLLSGEADKNDAFLEVNAGAGGTEAQDWALMLLRMYTRWCDSKGCKVEILDQSDGEEAGIKSTTLKISGHNAYGWLKSENGVHRLVRISPFDSNARRHTSFASIAVSPVISDDIDIQIEEKDLRIDTYRSSGAGGQHVNTTDSAVRITHIPTNVVVACQNQRSQHQNKDFAMGMLKAKLYELELQKQEQAKSDAHGEKTDIGWGHQIRSYVLHPYQMIKDLRTQVETTQSNAVLDGDLDMFLEASLAHKLVGDAHE